MKELQKIKLSGAEVFPLIFIISFFVVKDEFGSQPLIFPSSDEMQDQDFPFEVTLTLSPRFKVPALDANWDALTLTIAESTCTYCGFGSATNAEEIFSAITDKKITLILLMSKVYHCNCLC